MTDRERILAFAQGIIDEANHIVDEVGRAGATPELARAKVAEDLIALLDNLPAATSEERIPPMLLRSLADYRDGGHRPGRFLSAVLCGDLFTAMAAANEASRLALPAIVACIEGRLPGGSFGSPEAVSRWIARPRS